MTNTPETNTPELAPDDPRMGFAHATEKVGALIRATTPDQLGLPTPCDDFTVKELLDHLLLVMQRVAVIGNGGHWSEITEESAAQDSGHAEAFQAAAHDVMAAWTDAAKLDATYEVPWGELPGAPVMLTYTAELATHGWDLATATDQSFELDDAMLTGALFAAKMVPGGEARNDPEMPFAATVDPGVGASAVEQIAGWFGRPVA